MHSFRGLYSIARLVHFAMFSLICEVTFLLFFRHFCEIKFFFFYYEMIRRSLFLWGRHRRCNLIFIRECFQHIQSIGKNMFGLKLLVLGFLQISFSCWLQLFRRRLKYVKDKDMSILCMSTRNKLFLQRPTIRICYRQYDWAVIWWPYRIDDARRKIWADVLHELVCWRIGCSGKFACLAPNGSPYPTKIGLKLCF